MHVWATGNMKISELRSRFPPDTVDPLPTDFSPSPPHSYGPAHKSGSDSIFPLNTQNIDQLCLPLTTFVLHSLNTQWEKDISLNVFFFD